MTTSTTPRRRNAKPVEDAEVTTEALNEPSPEESTDGYPPINESLTAEERTAIISQAYSKATTILRERYLKEFQQIKQDECRKKGVAWTPPLTDEEKAEQQLAALLAAHPDLAAKVGAAQVAATS